jgi:hypothetical protein
LRRHTLGYFAGKQPQVGAYLQDFTKQGGFGYVQPPNNNPPFERSRNERKSPNKEKTMRTKLTKIAFTAMIALTATFSYSQEQKTISFGVRAGLNLNSGTLSPGGDEKEPAMLLDNHIGFHAGVVADIAINQFLYFQPGVMFSTKGGIMNYEDEYEYRNGDNYNYSYGKDTYTTNVYCIELPLMLSLKAPLTESLFLRANVGPYLDFGISGTFKTESEGKYEYRSSGYNDSDSYKEDDSQDIYPSDKERGINGKVFNFGIGVGGGLEFNSFYIGVSYYHGITNVLDDKDDELEAYDRTLGITLGYNF